ncbi:uncharacterized protein LOC126374641 [Pectinophora gossypiella]|uniref:uncharacterized protein LOC126374641 n=1 Tax=Pectinophora gossypiella TaxID=13191 RepID=UPI00214E8518|nr:uncharacterized protein LOC126374641 [Pectinophora gossypiella]
MQRIREFDSLQGFMSSFKQFERKLDKLQDDVNYHGNTLSELRTMVVNLAVAVNAEQRTEEVKMPKKAIGVQYEEHKPRRLETLQPLPSKLKAKSLQDQKYGLQPSVAPAQKKGSMPVVGKHHRPRKAEAPRKATTLRNQKTTDKKRIKPREKYN